MNMIFSIIGMIGGIICAIGDCLLDIKGKDNKKLGKLGFIDSNWDKMSTWRFKVSILCAMFAVPMYCMGILSLANQIGVGNATLGNILKFIMILSAMGGFFIHTLVCLMPIIYKTITKTSSFELADEVITEIFNAIRIPFYTLYLILALVPAGIIGYAIIGGIFNVPIWCIFLNPVVFQIVGWILRAVKRDWFYDAPAICAASLGFAAYGVVGIIGLL